MGYGYGYGGNRRPRTGVVYTDGACFRNGQPGASAGWGYYWPTSGNQDHGPVNGQQTNNRAELFAVLRALESALEDFDDPLEKVIIRTDSDLLIKTMTSYINKWRNNGWTTSKGTPVKNQDVLMDIDDLIDQFDEVIFEHVPAHKGIAGNERADHLAKLGARLD